MLVEICKDFGKATDAKSFAEIIRAIMAEQHAFDREKEQVYVLGLNTKHQVKYIDLVSIGTMDASLVHPREVFRHAVQMGAAKISMAHNHPSGDIEPSIEDITVTRRLIEAGKVLGIPLLDHLVLANDSEAYCSIRTERFDLNWS